MDIAGLGAEGATTSAATFVQLDSGNVNARASLGALFYFQNKLAGVTCNRRHSKKRLRPGSVRG
jgi:hypothetical protein